MNYQSSRTQKIQTISEVFSSLVGKKILGYELAQIWSEENQSWSFWFDIPLFLCIDNNIVISISWQKFDELGISFGRELPFSLNSLTVRWVNEGISKLDLAVNSSISSVFIGRGQMSIDAQEVEIWTRLLIHLSNGSTLEIFNALDENGFDFHSKAIDGEIEKCI